MQTTGHVLLVRPAHFAFNSETAESNAFQFDTNESAATILRKVQAEFDRFAEDLKANGVEVTVVQDTAEPCKPDAIFPNNWVSFHADGTVILYPMCATNRRTERRPALIEALRERYTIRNIIDLSEYEASGRFLEGTGSMVFDRKNRVAYACLSPRTDKVLFAEVAERLGYRSISFHACDAHGMPFYHTNVMMGIGDGFAVVCLESVRDEAEREKLATSLTATGHTIVPITLGQAADFAGNVLSLRSCTGEQLLVLSQRAFTSFDEGQREIIGRFASFLPLDIPTIETIGGGSARCMIAELFVPLSSR